MSHTKGPWTVVHTADDMTFIDTEEGSDNFIAQVDRNRPEYEDNAAILAAAPDLLEALEGIVKCHTDLGEVGEPGSYLDVAMRTIAKAKGV